MGTLHRLPEPTSMATFRALIEDAIAHGRLDDARLIDDERHAAQVREWRLKAQRAARRLDEARGRLVMIRGAGAVLGRAEAMKGNR